MYSVVHVEPVTAKARREAADVPLVEILLLFVNRAPVSSFTYCFEKPSLHWIQIGRLDGSCCEEFRRQVGCKLLLGCFSLI